MRLWDKSLVWGIVVAATASSATHAQEKPNGAPKVDAKADALLREMSDDLAKLRTFQVDAEHVTEVVREDGQKLQILAGAEVSVQRPNKLRSDRTGPVADVSFYYDGKTVTVYGKRTNMYATADAPETLDETIDFIREELSLEAPAADLLYGNVYDVLMEDVVSGMYVDKQPVGDRMCHHLAYRGNETDWQIWIEDGPRALPCRLVITSKKVEGMPEYMVDLSNWEADPALSADTFAFTPPRDAMKIDFLRAKQRAQTKRDEQRQGEQQ